MLQRGKIYKIRIIYQNIFENIYGEIEVGGLEIEWGCTSELGL